jgi:Cu+-exporting ATPase
MHLIVVSRDLGYFAHIHPQSTGIIGRYQVRHTFPAAGSYILYDELELAGKGDEAHRFDLQVGDAQGSAAKLTPDTGAGQIDGYTVSINTAGRLTSGATSTFVVTVKRNGQPVTDLEPYLGAAAHVVVLDESAGEFAHVHAISGDNAPTGDMAEMAKPPARFGPDLSFSHRFDKPGLYKVWVQFSRDGRVTTVPWVVEVR